MKNKIIYCLILLLIFIPVLYSITPPQKYKVEINILEFQDQGPGSLIAEIKYRDITKASFDEYLKEYNENSWYFTPSFAAKDPLTNEIINVYVSEEVNNFTFCKNYTTDSNGQFKITNFENDCGKQVSEYKEIKFIYLGNEKFQSLEHVFLVSKSPFSAISFTRLSDIFLGVITDINKNPLCIFVVILSGIVFAAMFFQGDNPLQIFDITQPKLPKAMKGLGGSIGKIKFGTKISAKTLGASKAVAASAAGVAALSASVYSAASKKINTKEGNALLSRARNSKKLNSLQKMYVYMLISKDMLAKAKRILNGDLILPSNYADVSEMIAYERKKAPIEVREVIKKKRFEKEIGYYNEKGVFVLGEYAQNYKKIGIEGAETDSQLVSNKVLKVRRVPFIGFAIALGEQAIRNTKSDIQKQVKTSFEFWKNPAQGIKNMAKKNWDETGGAVLKMVSGPLDAPVLSPTEMYTSLKKQYVDEDLYKGMGNSILSYTSRKYGEITDKKSKENFNNMQKILQNEELKEREKFEIALKEFEKITFRERTAKEAEFLAKTYSEINRNLNNYERQGSKYDIAQVNYVASLGRRYTVSKMLLENSKNVKDSQAYLDIFNEESSGAKGILDNLLNAGKFKLDAITTALGFTEAIGFAQPSMPTYIDYKEEIDKLAKQKQQTKGISYEEALANSEDEMNKALQIHIKETRKNMVHLMSDVEYSHRIRRGEKVSLTEIEKQFERRYDNWGRNPETFLNNMQRELYKYQPKENGVTFQEAYSQTIKDTDAFLYFYDNSLKDKDYFKSSNYEKQKVNEFLENKEEYLEKMREEGYNVPDFESAQGRSVEAQQEMVIDNFHKINKFAEELTEKPVLFEYTAEDAKPFLEYVDGKYRIVSVVKKEGELDPVKDIESQLEKVEKLRAYTDKPEDQLETWLKGGFWTDKSNHFDIARTNLFRNPKTLYKSALMIETPSGEVKEFNFSENYDFSNTKGFEFIGNVSGVSAFDDPVIMEKLKYLMRKGKIGIVER
ncbi:MAG: hypothetical protein WC356_04640 [Candidatus Micrarchaeia archaeon]|jgi:hypothetical protein